MLCFESKGKRERDLLVGLLANGVGQRVKQQGVSLTWVPRRGTIAEGDGGCSVWGLATGFASHS